jgi:hypothetical protein
MRSFSIVTDPQVQIDISLRSGKHLFVTPQEEALLKGGYYSTANNPVRRGQLFELLRRIYEQYNHNAFQMCEDLQDAFPNCWTDYERREMYKWFPEFRDWSKEERTVASEASKFVKKFRGHEEEVRKILWKTAVGRPISQTKEERDKAKDEGIGTKKGDPPTCHRSKHKN